MPGEVKVPEEAKRAAVEALQEIACRWPKRYAIAAAVEAAAPSLRAQGAEEAEGLRRRIGEAEALLGDYGAGGTPAGLVGGIHNLAHRAEKAEAELSQALAAGLSEEERRQLRDLANRIANDIEEEWPHAEEMRGHVRLLRKLATPKEGHPNAGRADWSAGEHGDHMGRVPKEGR